jgi:hypothetical protein
MSPLRIDSSRYKGTPTSSPIPAMIPAPTSYLILAMIPAPRSRCGCHLLACPVPGCAGYRHLHQSMSGCKGYLLSKIQA